MWMSAPIFTLRVPQGADNVKSKRFMKQMLLQVRRTGQHGVALLCHRPYSSASALGVARRKAKWRKQTQTGNWEIVAGGAQMKKSSYVRSVANVEGKSFGYTPASRGPPSKDTPGEQEQAEQEAQA